MAFDLVVSRHPVTVWWTEIARVLRPGGRYFSQQVGPAGVFEPVEFFLGPQPEAAGLRVVDLRAESLRTEFFDIGAVVYFLRKVIWMVPDFTVDPRVRRVRPAPGARRTRELPCPRPISANGLRRSHRALD
jgi:SAM-dependent methyltransferase